MIRWPSHIAPATVSNEVFSDLNWALTLLAAAGARNIKDEFLQGKEVAGAMFKINLDGFTQIRPPKARADGSTGSDLYVVDLQAAINRFIADHNTDPKPFVWTADPDHIIAAVRRGHQLLDSIH